MDEADRGGRELDDDHDLLTFNESAARLREEIAGAREQLALLAQHPDDAENESSSDRVRHRLDQLERSQERNSRQAAQLPGARGFLDYRGPGSTLPD